MIHGTKNPCYRHGYATGLKSGSRIRTEYRIWLKMRERCLSQKCRNYKDYGGRGIKICDRWLGKGGFGNFLRDMGPRPSAKFSLDRRDNDGDYDPLNCRWATRKIQNRNSRHNVNLTFDGLSQCINAWAEYFGVKINTFRSWIDRRGVKIAMKRGTKARESHVAKICKS